MHKIQVTMLIQSFFPHVGGAERQILALAPLLKTRGVIITVVTRRYRGLKAFEMVQGIPVHRLPIPGPKSLAAISYSVSALFAINKLKPDLIHAHELLSPATTAVLASWIFGLPTITKVLRGGKLGDIAKIMRRKVGQLRMKMLRTTLDGFVVISEEIDQELALHNVSKKNRHFIPNGVDVNHFKPVQDEVRLQIRKKLGLHPDKIIVVFAGRLVAEKQVDMLIRCWQSVGEVVNQATLLILGDGEERLKLERMTRQGVKIIGQKNNVVDYLQAADVFVLPSSTEGLSNAILEAMAVGLPVIATKVGGAPDVIEHGVSGWLIKPDDEAEMNDALAIVMTDAILRDRVGSAAREFVVQHYALEKTADKLHTLYGALLEKEIK